MHDDNLLWHLRRQRHLQCRSSYRLCNDHWHHCLGYMYPCLACSAMQPLQASSSLLSDTRFPEECVDRFLGNRNIANEEVEALRFAVPVV